MLYGYYFINNGIYNSEYTLAIHIMHPMTLCVCVFVYLCDCALKMVCRGVFLLASPISNLYVAAAILRHSLYKTLITECPSLSTSQTYGHKNHVYYWVVSYTMYHSRGGEGPQHSVFYFTVGHNFNKYVILVPLCIAMNAAVLLPFFEHQNYPE